MTPDIKQILEGTKETLKFLDLIETRIANQFVIMTDDGHVLTKNRGVGTFDTSLDEIHFTRNDAALLKLLDQVKENNPDNPVAQNLKIGTLRKAAKLQRPILEDLVEKLENL